MFCYFYDIFSRDEGILQPEYLNVLCKIRREWLFYFLLPPNCDPERRVKVNCYAQLTSAALAHAQRCNFLIGVLEL